MPKHDERMTETAHAKIVVPPFGGLDRPALGPHILQACAREAGAMGVAVSYASLDFARSIGLEVYHAICYGPTTGLAGERVFAALAFDDVPRLGRMRDADEAYFKRRVAEKQARVDFETLVSVAESAAAWIDGYVERLIQDQPRVVGCSSTFEQTCAALAILKRVKVARPQTVTILGGANLDGPMAQGIATIAPFVDYVFSGECESVFPRFLGDVENGQHAGNRVVPGSPCNNLDAIPTPVFTEYYAQLEQMLPDSPLQHQGAIWLPYESSRGCWWGQKSHCTFCGINGQTMAFRAKSPERVISELETLINQHPTRNVCMVDNIMPMQYFETLLPRLTTEAPGLHIFYEQKANLRIEQVKALRDAGVAIIQPGIEALNSELLKLMRKGVSARQNIALLRYCRMFDVAVNWNVLFGMPGDEESWYVDTNRIMPLLVHLHPPTGAFHLSIDRFSPYFNQPSEFGIVQTTPMAAYYDIMPAGAPHSEIAYHFVGEYRSGIKEAQATLDELRAALGSWREKWTEGVRPALHVSPLTMSEYLLCDTRGLPGNQTFSIVNELQARAAIFGRGERSVLEWALESSVAVDLDGHVCPLATTDYENYLRLDGHAAAATLQRE